MIPGTLLCDDRFQYLDGPEGRKILVILGCCDEDYCVVVKTTSRGHRYSKNSGCQLGDPSQNYFLELGSCDLEDDTWVQFGEFHPIQKSELRQKLQNKTMRQIGKLLKPLATNVLQCALQTRDISKKHLSILQDNLTRLQA